MTRGEVKALLDALVEKYEGDDAPPLESRAGQFDPPTREDWEYMETKFNCSFSPEFVSFMELITDYNCPSVLNVRRGGRTNGDPTLDQSYDREMSFGRWNPDLIPFLDMGNGDYFCLSASRGEHSPVYYVYHEGGEEELTGSFEEWLGRLDYFLNG